MSYVAISRTRQYQIIDNQNPRWFSLVVCALFFSLSLNAQLASLSGNVIDENAAPVFAANVYLKHAPELGTITDLDGSFSLALGENIATDTLVVSFIGYEEWQQPIANLQEAQPLTITLAEIANELQTVYVKASQSISEEFAVAQLKKMDIYLNPVSAADPLKALTTLAGSTNTDESANPSLRGSSFARSRVVLNGVPVVNPVRNSQINGVGNFSLFNTELIEFQNVYAGNPPIIYGNTSAGLVEIETRNSLKSNKYQATVSLSNLGLFASQKLSKKSFVQVYGNYQFPGLFLAANPKSFDGLDRFGAKDYGINFHHEFSPKWSVNVFNYGIDEAYRIQQNLFGFQGTAESSRWRNFTVANLRYQDERYWVSFNQGIDWSDSDFELGNLTSNKQDAQYYSALNYKQFITPSFSVQTGAVHEFSKTDFANQSPIYYFALAPDAPSFQDTIALQNRLLEGYAYLKWDINNALTLGGGIRKNLPLDGQRSYWSGQASLRYTLDQVHAFVLGGGHYNNFSLPSFYDTNYQLLSSNQIALEYFYKKNAWDIQLAGFYKTEQGDVQLTPSEPTSSHRKIIGAEMRVDWNWKDQFRVTLANTFLNATIQNGEESFRAQNDLNYFVKAIVSYAHPKLGVLAFSFIQRPGTYYTPISGGRFVEEAGAYEPLFLPATNSAQLPTYSTFDLNYSKVIKLPNSSNVIIYVTVSNILNRTNMSNLIHAADFSEVVDIQHFQKRSFYIGGLFTLYR